MLLAAARSRDFIEYFVEQDFLTELTALLIPALIYAVIVSLLAASFAPVSSAVRPHPITAAVLVGVVTMAVVVTVFEGLALYFRSDPPGTGGEEGSTSWTTPVFFALYAAVLVLAGTIARVRDPDIRVTAAAVGAVAIFMLLTFPFVEFLNACDIGRSILLDASC